MPHDYPDGMDDPRNIAEQREKNIQPKVEAKADLQEHAQRRQKDGKDYTNDIHKRVGSRRCSVVASNISNMTH